MRKGCIIAASGPGLGGKMDHRARPRFLEGSARGLARHPVPVMLLARLVVDRTEWGRA